MIDPADNEPVAGEIYVVKISSPHEETGFELEFVQLRAGLFQFGVAGPRGEWARNPERSTGWMRHYSLIRPRSRPLTRDEVVAGLRLGSITMCDGPLRTEGMRNCIVGRVIGVVLETAAA